ANGIQADRCHKVNVVIDTPLFTLIPEKYYEDSFKEDYFVALFGEKNGLELMSDSMAYQKSRMIYGINEKLAHYLTENFSALSIFHNLHALLENQKETKDKNTLYVVLHPQYISVLSFSNGQLLLAQSYKTATPLDAVYYILNVSQQHPFEENISLYLSGYDKDFQFLYEKLKDKF